MPPTTVGKAYGLQAYRKLATDNAYAELNNVTIINSKGAGLTVNGSTVIADNLNTSGSLWGAVNVDPGSGVETPSSFTLTGTGTLTEDLQIWSDGANINADLRPNAIVEVTALGFTDYQVVYAGYPNYRLWATAQKNMATNQRTGLNYPTITAAIADAADADEITVAPGTYVENVSVNKAITLTGAGATSSKIVATDGNSTPLVFAANGATVSGFTITHEYTAAEISAWNFNNNGVRFNTSTTGNTLSNCTVTLNRNGIYLNNTQGNIIQNNTIINNRTGINMTSNIDNTQILGNTISENWTLGFVYYGSGTSFSTVKLENNTFEQNWYSEILIKDAAGSTGTLNVSTNTFADGPVTYTTLDDSYTALNEPGFADLKPLLLGAGTAVKPDDELPTLRIYNSGCTIMYNELGISSVDRAALEGLLDTANTDLNNTYVSIDGEDVNNALYWVTAGVWDDYETAINSAQAVLDDGTATQTQVDDAFSELDLAVSAFSSEKQLGNSIT